MNAVFMLRTVLALSAVMPLAALLTSACGDDGGQGNSAGSTGTTTTTATTGEPTTGEGSAGATGSTSGSTSTGGSSTTDDPFDDPPKCTSREYWTEDDGEGDEAMNPGEACITCHASQNGAPDFVIAGTIYPTAHEPNDCNSAPPATDAEVHITDAMNQLFVVEVNGVGNFFLADDAADLVFPFTAKVVVDGAERPMAAPQTSGDCNKCHTQDGANGAPGRIIPP